MDFEAGRLRIKGFIDDDSISPFVCIEEVTRCKINGWICQKCAKFCILDKKTQNVLFFCGKSL